MCLCHTGSGHPGADNADRRPARRLFGLQRYMSAIETQAPIAGSALRSLVRERWRGNLVVPRALSDAANAQQFALQRLRAIWFQLIPRHSTSLANNTMARQNCFLAIGRRTSVLLPMCMIYQACST